MPQTKNKLNEMYWTGYCDATINNAAGTSQDGHGRDLRMRWAQQHFNYCDQCKMANIVKALEYECAASMGPDAQQLFQNGGDVRGLPGFKPALRSTMESAIERGLCPPSVYRWMTETATRYGTDWPGLDHVKVAQPS